MSDFEQPPQAYPPPPPPAPDQNPPQYGPPQYPPAQPVTPQSSKKKTGLIIAVVVIAVLLLCCCGAGGAAFLIYRADQGSSSSSGGEDRVFPGTDDEPDADQAARLAEWQKVKDAFVRFDFEFVEADQRASRLAKAAIEQLLPDFRIEEIKVEHGVYNEQEGWHYWDQYFVLLALKQDPSVKTAWAFWVHTPDGDALNTPRDQITIEEGEDVVQLEGRTWVIYPTESKIPLLGGIEDDSYANLMKQAMEDFPGGLPTQLLDQEDGSVIVHVETWDSYCWSETYDRIEATYEPQNDGWLLLDYEAVIESKEAESDASGA